MCAPDKDYANPDIIKFIENEFNGSINDIRNGFISKVIHILKEEGCGVTYNEETETLHIVDCERWINNYLKKYMHTVVETCMHDYIIKYDEGYKTANAFFSLF